MLAYKHNENFSNIYIYIYIYKCKCINMKKKQGIKRMILFIVELFANVICLGFYIIRAVNI